ncbi:MAG: ATP-binding protein, partial [Ignavibacteriaceae bacterium]
REEKLTNSLDELQNNPDSIDYLRTWLSSAEKINLIIKNPFILNNNGGIVTTLISSGWQKDKIDLPQVSDFIAVDFRKAESAEFSEENYKKAAMLYKGAMKNATSEDSTVLISGIARCYFKNNDYDLALEEYKLLLKFKNNNLTIGAVPVHIAALTQEADIYSKMNGHLKRFNVLVDIYKNLIESPWNSNEGEYNYYLKSASSEILNFCKQYPVSDTAKQIIKNMERKELKIYEDENYVNIIRNIVFPRIEFPPKNRSLNGPKLQHLQLHNKNSVTQIGYFIIPKSIQKTGPLVFGFQIDTGYVFTSLLPGILKEINLGNNIYAGLLNQRDSILYSMSKLSGQKYLIAENLSDVFSTWKIALFDREGKSIDQQINSEKQQAFLLFGLTVFVLLIGIVIIISAAKHEYQISKLKSDFVSNVSHELKTPLSIIRMFGETLESGIVTDKSQQQEFYGIIKRESERLTGLINNVLDFSKIKSRKKEFHFKEANILEVVNDVVDLYRPQIINLGFRFEVSLPEKEIILTIDKDAISQALINLLNNAVKYSDDRKDILVKVSSAEKFVFIAVADQGIGIHRKEFKTIFENFYRITNSRTGKIKGTGLGLTIAKHIVEAHKGTITVESEVDKGSSFTITIPQHNHLS